ncbi:Outer membrane protein beta-barrel domain-containing protein [Flexibacter flexilis DSM 6793]|uniref:Outer membrane protein beta-barrel domain-containing protein n=1 Tax=Flexibacter flexilis DSM 6793 TaxID=927664 RepID=A0A1I1IQQ4_9BACT|nr:outer membrane beta-barrel protein [Flexibacter flexilis]SFC38617.1 Outer membrane protein beta-barrel domain-containing protein [Flexibacter flexilis DSM 6793]
MKSHLKHVLFLLLSGLAQQVFAQNDIYYTPPPKPTAPPVQQEPVKTQDEYRPTTQKSNAFGEHKTKVYLGSVLGVGSYSMSIDPAPSGVTYKNFGSFRGGANLFIKRDGNRFSYQVGLLFNNKKSGFEYNYHNQADSVVSDKYDFYYVGVPLMLSYSLVDTRSFNLYLSAGLEYNILASAKEKVTPSWDKDDVTYVYDIKKTTKSSELAFIYSLGADARLTDKLSWVASVNLINGASNINNGFFQYVGGATPNISNSGFNISTGLLFRIY